MKTFLRQELERFLTAVDEALDQSFEVVVIGGSAAALPGRFWLVPKTISNP